MSGPNVRISYQHATIDTITRDHALHYNVMSMMPNSVTAEQRYYLHCVSEEKACYVLMPIIQPNYNKIVTHSVIMPW